MKRIHDLGVGRVVVLDVYREWCAEFVDDTIPCEDPCSPLSDPDKPETDARVQSILSYMKEKNITFDGIWTFADASVILCAQIAHFFENA